MAENAEALEGGTAGAEAPILHPGASDRDAVTFLKENRKRTKAAIQSVKPSESVDAADVEEQPDEVDRIASDVADAKPEGEGQEALEALTEGDETSESEDAGSFDIPTNFDDLAAALEVDPADLAQALTVKRTVNGQVIEESIEDLRLGALRQSDFSRSMDELAQSRRDFESERTSALERAKQHDDMVSNWMGVLANALQMGPSDADLVQLAQTDPDRYTQVKAHREALVNAYRQVEYQRKDAHEKAQKEADDLRVRSVNEQRQALVNLSRDKTTGIPNPDDPTKWAAFEGEMRNYLKGRGFSDDQVGSFLSPGGWEASQVAVIADAMLGRQMRQKGKGIAKKVKHIPKVLKPGVPKDRKSSAQEKIEAARARLRGQGSGAQGAANAVALLKAKRAGRKAR